MSNRPKYAMIADQLIQLILNKEKTTNERFFTEKELALKFAVSRSTIRAALSELEDLKFIAKEKNVGYYVSYEPATYDFAHFYSFSRSGQEQNLAPATEIILFTKTIPNYYVAQMLQLDKNETVYRLERLRLLQERPVLFEKTFLPARLFPALRRHQLVKNSLYELLAQKYGLQVKHGTEEFFASTITEREADLLSLRPNASCLKILRTAFDQHERPIEFTITTAPSHYFSYKVPLDPDK